MPTHVQAPDGTTIEFPDSMKDADIESAMGKLYPAPVDSPKNVSSGHTVPGKTPAERQHWIHDNPEWAKALGEGPQAIGTGRNAMALPQIHPVADAASFAASPITGLLGIPKEVLNWASRGLHNPPSGGFLSENPLSQAYGDALAAVATPAGREPGTAEVGPVHKVLANPDLRNQVMRQIPGVKWVPNVLDIVKKANEPTGSGWSSVPPEWRADAPAPPPGMDAFGKPMRQLGARPAPAWQRPIAPATEASPEAPTAQPYQATRNLRPEPPPRPPRPAPAWQRALPAAEAPAPTAAAPRPMPGPKGPSEPLGPSASPSDLASPRPPAPAPGAVRPPVGLTTGTLRQVKGLGISDAEMEDPTISGLVQSLDKANRAKLHK